MAVETATVHLWGRTIGAVAWDEATALGRFEYDPAFQTSGIEPAPLMMPLGSAIHQFPELNRETYLGLPGMLADALPDKFGNALIDQWLASRGRTPGEFSPIERLCYVGNRGMGALEFEPAARLRPATTAGALDIEHLVTLASQALARKESLALDSASGSEPLAEDDLRQIIQVGTSAGGARAKAVIGWNAESGEVRSGQLSLPAGFTHWLVKFDGVSGNRDKELADPAGYGRIEYAYSMMAAAAGITMAPTRLLEEGGRAHFMTQRFDRVAGAKIHMQTLAAIAHFDFNQAGAYSYEQAMQVMRRIGLPYSDLKQQFRRAVFNAVTRNQDDHTKNIAFLMDKQGRWALSPAYDVTYSYNPDGAWTSQHQMRIAGKQSDFTRSDLLALAADADVNAAAAGTIITEVLAAAARWEQFAEAAGVPPPQRTAVGTQFRMDV